MNDKDYMKWVRDWTQNRPSPELLGWHKQLLWSALGLSGEVGEVLDEIKKGLFYPSRGGNLDTDALMLELGDVEFFLTLICRQLGFTIEQVREAHIAKLEKKREGEVWNRSQD
jgi:NTP pyrophosphatase (non-canonical NTP hydrolase)